MQREATRVIVRFAGDSGDGIQLTGDRLAKVSALFGNGVVTLADFPAEIRAPSGTTYGVSGYQLQIGSDRVLTPGDQVDILVAMNPAALKTNLTSLKPGGVLIANEDAFITKNFERAGIKTNPLETDELSPYKLYKIPMNKQTAKALEDSTLGAPDKARCKNFFALGLISWLLDRPVAPTTAWIEGKFGRDPAIALANRKALEEGMRYAETSELFNGAISIPPADLCQASGTYKFIGGNAALALGLVAAAEKAQRSLFFGSYPITPASDVLHELSKLWDLGVTTFQAEDEIAAVGAAIGASYAGSLAVTATSGPGLVLKQEFIGLAVMTELPLVILDVQRAGPSTGMPTKTEQADLNLALYGRNGESPVVVIAPLSPADCFKVAYDACRYALKYMVPVVILSDGYLANGLEAWRIPEIADLEDFVTQRDTTPEGEEYMPYRRNPETLARPWVTPGTPDKQHRIGGLEKENVSGKISYDPDNHEAMVALRRDKVRRVAKEYAATEVFGAVDNGFLLLGWGSSFGPIRQALADLKAQDLFVNHVQLRHIHPLPEDLGGILSSYKRIFVIENNLGQLLGKLRLEYADLDFAPVNQVNGQPMKVATIVDKVLSDAEVRRWKR